MRGYYPVSGRAGSILVWLGYCPLCCSRRDVKMRKAGSVSRFFHLPPERLSSFNILGCSESGLEICCFAVWGAFRVRRGGQKSWWPSTSGREFFSGQAGACAGRAVVGLPPAPPLPRGRGLGAVVVVTVGVAAAVTGPGLAILRPTALPTVTFGFTPGPGGITACGHRLDDVLGGRLPPVLVLTFPSTGDALYCLLRRWCPSVFVLLLSSTCDILHCILRWWLPSVFVLRLPPPRPLPNQLRTRRRPGLAGQGPGLGGWGLSAGGVVAAVEVAEVAAFAHRLAETLRRVGTPKLPPGANPLFSVG
eukprot:Hpha_TRINITY_DN16324_c1_g1::TRINITY_DN16324_c1_g1_i6::g.58368::m.58368